MNCRLYINGKKMRKIFYLSVAIVVTMVLFAIPSARGSTITFEYFFEFSGGTPPVGSTPWLTATFDDHGESGLVTLTLSTSGLTGDEFVTGWYFNFNPDKNLGGLSILELGADFAKGTDSFKADGDGLYDILFTWPSGPPSSRFGADQEVVITFILTGLVATDFYFLSAPDGGHGPFLSAAHVLGIGENGEKSGWVATAVPEPATLFLLGSGLVGLGILGRKRLKKD